MSVACGRLRPRVEHPPRRLRGLAIRKGEFSMPPAAGCAHARSLGGGCEARPLDGKKILASALRGARWGLLLVVGVGLHQLGADLVAGGGLPVGDQTVIVAQGPAAGDDVGQVVEPRLFRGHALGAGDG